MIKSKAWNWSVADAPQWNETASEVFPLLYRWKKENLVNLLDLGCGIGRHSIFFAQNGFKVSAFDLGKEGLEKLANLNKELKLSIKIKEGDMLNLPYKDGEFDSLLAYHTIYHQDEEGIKRVIGEIYRVLKKGGEAFISLQSKKSWSFTSGKGRKITENTIVKTEGHEAGIPHYYSNKEGVKNLFKDFEIIEFSHKEEYYDEYVGAHYFVLIKKIVPKTS